MPNVALIAGPLVDLASAASALADALGLQVVSAGNVFRRHVQQKTPLGEEANGHMRAGQLVTDELMVRAVAGALADVDGGWVLYGFPRKIRQAELLARGGHVPDTVIELVLTDDQLHLAIQRRVERRMELDPQVAVRRRQLLRTYANAQENHQAQIEPLRAYYRARGLLRTVSGFGDFEDVAARMIPIASQGQCGP
ncbi:nucleoside monophosphate kinase [Micromonospora sp. ANENR4]|uniref:adenylate kinase family protein n=1 Tax=unclassified Micromonospora TaxID=2617518 RepID=UPI00188E55EB|nr:MULTISPECIES: nucleoside monophosphate kinase [unclassified Micromonospora]MBF5028439.1 nucleoside monophosphate kinase [Micromonospora sp. ANENR4]MCZ7473090.1 nucleoside monophosphate kinase [Micromonospora sp. WMMC273]